MKRIAMAIVLCAGCVAPAQEVKPQAKEPERPPPEAPRPTVIADEGSSVEYRGQAEGKSTPSARRSRSTRASGW